MLGKLGKLEKLGKLGKLGKIGKLGKFLVIFCALCTFFLPFALFKMVRAGLGPMSFAKGARIFPIFPMLFVTLGETHTTSEKRPKRPSTISECCGKLPI